MEVMVRRNVAIKCVNIVKILCMKLQSLELKERVEFWKLDMILHTEPVMLFMLLTELFHQGAGSILFYL